MWVIRSSFKWTKLASSYRVLSRESSIYYLLNWAGFYSNERIFTVTNSSLDQTKPNKYRVSSPPDQFIYGLKRTTGSSKSNHPKSHPVGLLKPNREAHKILYRKTRPSSMKTEEGRGGQKKQCKRFIPFALVKLIPKHTDNNQQIARAFPWTQLGAATREASQLIHGFLSLPM